MRSKNQTPTATRTRNRTALDRSRTDHISLIHDLDPAYDLDLQSLASYGHDLYSHAIVRGQRSMDLEDGVHGNKRTEGKTRMEGCDCITTRDDAVGKSGKDVHRTVPPNSIVVYAYKSTIRPRPHGLVQVQPSTT